MIRSRWSILPLILASAVALAAPARTGPPDAVVTALADRSTAPGDLAKGLESRVKDATGVDRAWLMLTIGELRRLGGEPDTARRWYVDLLSQAAGDSFDAAARLGMALLDAERAGVDSTTLHTLIATSEHDVPDSQNADRFGFLAVRAVLNATDASAHVERAHSYAVGRPDLLARIDARVAAASVPKPTTPAAAPAPVVATSTVSPAAVSADPLREARDALADEHRDDARAKLTAAQANSSTPAVQARAALLLKALDGAHTDATRVGVLLPLSGKYGTAGQQVKEALNVGWSMGGAKQQLVFADTAGTPDGALAALDDLVLSKGVVGVIGPLLSPELLPVVERADAYGVPLVALNQGLDDASTRPYVFQGWLTIRQQVDALLDHTVGKLGITTYAVLEPDNDYGHASVDAFVAGAAAHGATITVRHLYDPDGADYRESGRAIGRKGREDDVPLIDFGAIFLPDKARRVSLVAAGVAVEDVPVGGFIPQGSDKSVRLLGLSGWNAYDLLATGGSYMTRALFTDVFVPPPERANHWYAADGWQSFVDDFRSRTTRTPTPVEALAVDLGNVVSQAIRDGAPTRLSFRDALIDVVATGTLTGATRFDPLTHVLNRKVRVLSVEKDGFSPVTGDAN